MILHKSESSSWSRFVSVIITEKRGTISCGFQKWTNVNNQFMDTVMRKKRGKRRHRERREGAFAFLYTYITALWLIPYLLSINICLNRGSFINEPNGKYAHSSICAVWEKIFKYLFSKPPRVAQIIDTTLRRSISLNMSVYIHLSALGIWNYKMSLFIRSSVNTLRLIFTAA